MRVNMSATGSVNLILCFSSNCPFAPSHRRTRGSCSACSNRAVVHQPRPKKTTNDHLLPGRLRHAWNFSPQGKPAETQAADAELADVRARPSADLAAVVLARGELRLSRVLNSFCCSRHLA